LDGSKQKPPENCGFQGAFKCFDIRAVQNFIGLSKIAKPYKKIKKFNFACG